MSRSVRGGGRGEETDFFYREDIRRDDRPPPAVRVREREREREPPRREERDFEEIDIYSRRSRAPSRGPVERERVTERERERDREPDFLRNDRWREEQGPLVLRKREVEEIERPFERRPRSPTPERERIRTSTKYVERRERTPSPPPIPRETVRIIERRREPSPPSPPPEITHTRTRIIERERRERTPSPPPVERVTRTKIIERERERTPSPSPSPPPPVVRAPPIHQEIITHHRHIDHGFEIAHAPSPPPRRREREETEIDIYTGRGETEIDIRKSRDPPRERERERREPPRSVYDDDVIYERERDRERLVKIDSRSERARSVSTRGDIFRDRESESSEADYYNRKAEERAYIGEAYNGATKDWAIVDVPPGTERVRMDGVGGGSQEISWQRYNGVRRSKFLPEREREAPPRPRELSRPREPSREVVEREEIKETVRSPSRGGHEHITYEYEKEEVTDRTVGMPRPPPKAKAPEMWTEITKDLVVRQAIEEMGYDFQEVEDFFYVMDYLRYDDVLELVKLSDEIRRDRERRIRQIQRERERAKELEELDRKERERARRDAEKYDEERVIEREIIYEGPPRRAPRGYR